MTEYSPLASCPYFDEALMRAFRKSTDPAAMSRHFMEFFGYIIQRKKDFNYFFVLQGKSGSKFELIRIIREVVGNNLVHRDRFVNMTIDRFGSSALVNKLILIDDYDVGASVGGHTRCVGEFIKKLVLGESIRAQSKNRGDFNFVPSCTPVLIVDGCLMDKDIHKDVILYTKIIPFTGDVDPKLFKRVRETELPGVLNAAIEGMQRLQKRGHFDEPVDCKNAFSN